MAIIEKNIKSKVNDLDIGITIVTPAKNKKVKSIIQLVSGINEDRKNYMPFLNFLARKGYIGVINNHFVNKEDDLKYIVDNVYQVTELIKKDFPNKNVTLIGNNIGGLIVKNYIQKYDDKIDKVIISGSISKSNNLIGPIIVKTLKLIKENAYSSAKLNDLFLPKYFNNYEDIEFNINQLNTLFKLHKNAYNNKRYKVINKDLSILIIAGTEDKIIINEDKFYESCYFIKEIGYKTDYILYKDKVYDLLNNDFSNIIYEDILDFIEEN